MLLPDYTATVPRGGVKDNTMLPGVGVIIILVREPPLLLLYDQKLDWWNDSAMISAFPTWLTAKLLLQNCATDSREFVTSRLHCN